jgi:hypothetical protein
LRSFWNQLVLDLEKSLVYRRKIPTTPYSSLTPGFMEFSVEKFPNVPFNVARTDIFLQFSIKIGIICYWVFFPGNPEQIGDSWTKNFPLLCRKSLKNPISSKNQVFVTPAHMY